MSVSIHRRPSCRAAALPILLLIPMTLIATSAGAENDAAAGRAVRSATPDWSLEQVSDQVKNATALCIDDAGRIYVTETYRWLEGIEDNRDHTYWIMDDLACQTVADRSRLYQKWRDKFAVDDYFTRFADRVVRLEDRDGDGRAETLQEFAGGFNADVDGPAIGVLTGEAGLYVTCVPHLWLLRDNDGDGRADQRDPLLSGFGVKNSLAGHDLHGLAWGPDGKLYFSMGDRGFHCVSREGRVLSDPNSGAVFRCNPDGSELEIVYHQLRNPQELAFNQYGDLFTVDNNCDQGDSARICYLLEGGTSGWHIGGQALTTYEAHIDDGGMEQAPHWLSEGLWKLRFADQPAHILPPIAHLTNGPSGMTFHSGVGYPERYQNHFLVCDYKGAPSLCFLYSFRVEPDGAGYAARDEHIVRGGIAVSDVEIGHDGKIYVTDFGGGWKRSDRGSVYALFDPAAPGSPDVVRLTRIFREGFAQRSDHELIDLLAHGDMRVRLRSQFELARRGPHVVPLLTEVARSAPVSVARYHAIWGLGQRKAVEPLLEFIRDDDAEIRAQAARTLGQAAGSDDAHVPPALRRALADTHPRVRSFAAISLARLRDRQALPEVLQLIEKNDNRDAFERHAGVYALEHIAASEQLAELNSHTSSAVRLAAVLALRRQRQAAVADFLDDPDPQVVAETIRAINDEAIPGAVRRLAEYATKWAAEDAPAPPDEMLFRRLINACVRSGRPQDAATLVHLASRPSLPAAYRVLCLKAVARFDNPSAIDPTLGIYRPLPARNAAPIVQAIDVPLRALFEQATGELASAAIQAMDRYGLRLDAEALVRRVRDGRQPVAVRQIALEQLFNEQRFDQKVLLKSLTVDESPELRAAAARKYVAAFPDEAGEVLHGLLERGDDLDLRTTFDLLAEQNSDLAADILVEQLDRLLRGELYRTVHLDLYEAALRSPDPRVQAKRLELEKTLADEGRTPDDFLREGGDPENGRLVFQNQGVCLKCHRTDQGGGNAGPDLTSIGRLRRSDELLESVLHPNARLVPGYGTLTVYLDDGTSITGTLIEETDTALALSTPAGRTQTIDKERIEERTQLTSPMPDPREILSRKELRDVLAYLQELLGEQ